jgi:hypothetical protein
MGNAALVKHLHHTASLVSLRVDFRLDPSFRATECLKLIVQNKINQQDPDLVHNGFVELVRLLENVSDVNVAKALIGAMQSEEVCAPCLKELGDIKTLPQCAATICQFPEWKIGYSLVFAIGDLHRVANEQPPFTFEDRKALDMRVRIARYFEAKGRSAIPSSEKITTLLERAMKGHIKPLPKNVVDNSFEKVN